MAEVEVSETYYRDIVENQTELICRYDADFRLKFANRAYCEWLGQPLDDLLQINILERIPSEDRQQAVAHVRALTPDHPVAVSAHRSIMPDGSYRWIEWTDRALFGTDGRLIEYQGVGRDITERKQAGEALHASEIQLRALVDSQTNYVLRTNLEGRYTYCNRKFEEEFGWIYEPQGILGSNALDSICDHHHQLTRETVEKCLAEPGKVIKIEIDKPGRDGRIRTTLWEFVCLTDANGLPIEMQCAGIEITDLKQAEAALHAGEKRYRQMFELHGLPKLIIDPETGGIFDANPAAEQFYGYDLATLRTLRIFDLSLVPQGEIRAKLGQVVDDQLRSIEVVHRLADGRPRQVEVFVVPLEIEGRLLLYATITDITEQRQAKAALEEANRLLEVRVVERTSQLETATKRIEAIFNHSGDGILLLHIKDGIQQANHAFDALFDVPADSYFGKRLPELFYPEDAARIETIIQDAAAAHRQFHVEARAKRADGTGVDVEISIAPVNRSDQVVANLVCIIRDITDRKQAEQALEKYAAEVHDLYNNAPAGYHSLDQDGLIVQINDTELRWLGYTREEAVAKLTFLDIITPAGRPTFEANFLVLKKQGWVKDLEFEMRRKDSSTFSALMSATAIYDETGQYSHSRSTLFDITERKRAQRATAEESNLLRTLINSVPDFIYVKDRQHRIVLANTALARFVGYDEAPEIYGKTNFDLYPAEMAAGFQADEDRIFETGQPLYNSEELRVGRDGREIWALTTKVPLRDLDGEIIGLVGITRDISAIKAHEIALRESKERYHSTITAMAEGIVLQGREGDIQLCNAAAERILGLTADEMMGRTSLDPRWRAIHEDGSPFPGETHPIMVTLRTGQPQSNVVMGVHKPDGALIWILINSQPLVEPGQLQPYAAVATFADITARKAAESALEEKRREEREMQSYLKALHHITLRLTRAETLDDFYRSTVELGLAYFGFERLGLALYDAQTGAAGGTYGTNLAGAVVNEYHLKLDAADQPAIFRRTTEHGTLFVLDEAVELYDGYKPIGMGSQAVAALWNSELLGWLAVDNGIHHRPISRAQLDILALYALTVGSLLARKHAESALRESEERYRLLAENIRDVIVKTSPQGIRTFITPSCYELVGYRPEELVGRLGLDFVHPDDRVMTREIVERAVGSGAAYFILMHRMQHKAGHYVWVEMTNTIVRDAVTGEVVEFIGIAHDITERKQSEDALRESEEKFRTFIEAAPIATFITDQTGTIMLVNREMEKLFGYSRDELIGRPVQVLVPDEARQQYERHVEDYMIAGHKRRSEVMELAARRKDGSVFPADLQLSYINLKPDPMVMSFVIDITQRKQVEQTLKDALAQERELGELKTRFVSMASHEFRTPLASILAVSETLAYYRQKMDEAQIDERLGRIRQQVMYMKDIMEDVLQLARIQAGRVEFKPSWANLDKLCQEIIEEFDSQEAYRGRIMYTCASPPVTWFFDERLVRQIVSNLVSNALKYSARPAYVYVRLAQDETQVVLTVKDEGIGIPPDDIRHLYEPFHRAANVGTISGTGLGLSITKQAVELHGGTIALDTRIGVGSTFTVTFPRVSTEDEPHGQDSGD